MKISYNWLKEYLPLDFNLSPDKVAEYLTDSGLEVEGIEVSESVPGGLKGLVIGEVIHKEKHPDADKLNLTKVNIGQAEPLSIVCGASNVEIGQKVVVATINAKLFPSKGEPFVIKKSKIRGQESEGMICAEDEIGLGEDHAGIMVLDSAAQIGSPAAEYFNLENDHVLEIGLTPNRADAMSHFGVARDLVAVINTRTGSSLSLRNAPESFDTLYTQNKTGKISCEVLDTQKCPRYAGLYIDNITVKPSPEWLQNRLRSIGLRPLNNIVDVTNYVCHAFAQPLHAFDAKKISNSQIFVKTESENTPFTTLDGVERKLNTEDLMISSADGPMCIAGVFGGEESGVTDNTTEIFLESAWFNPVSVRKSARRHALNTDASFRFERGIDPDITVKALHYAAKLIADIAGGTISPETLDIYPDKIEDHTLNFSLSRCNSLLGIIVEPKELEFILDQLDIEIINAEGDNYNLSVPAFRNDVTRECDIAEEILRLKSFNSIEIPSKMSFTPAANLAHDPEKIQEMAASMLSSQGFVECLSNSLTKGVYSEWVDQDEMSLTKQVSILNPLSSELNVLRQSMLFSGLENIAFNINRRNSDLQLFEFGRTYHKKESGGYFENRHLAMFLTGANGSENWKNKNLPSDFFDLKKAVYTFFAKLGISKGISEKGPEELWTGNSLSIIVQKKKIAVLSKISDKWLQKMDIKQDVYFADIQWDQVLNILPTYKTSYKSLIKFPAVRRDLSLTLNQSTSFAEIEEIAKKQDKELIKEISLFDVYEGKNLGEGKKSYAISLTLQNSSKTLTDQEIDSVMQKIISSLEKEVGATLRN